MTTQANPARRASGKGKGIIIAAVLLTLAVTLIYAVVRINHDNAAHQQLIANCQVVYNYTAQQCAKLYP